MWNYRGSRCCTSEPKGETLLDASLLLCRLTAQVLNSGSSIFQANRLCWSNDLSASLSYPTIFESLQKVSLIVTQMIARLFWNKIIPLGVTRWHCGDDDIVSRAHQCADVRRTTRAVARQESRFSSAPWGISMHSTWWNHFGSRRQIMAQSDIQSLPIELRLTLAAVLCGDYWP